MKRAKRKKRPAPSELSASLRPAPSEDRAVLAATVLWMLTLLSSLAAELGAVGFHLAVRLWPIVAGEPDWRRMTAGALLLSALATGVLCLVLTPLVWRLRPARPPLPIVVIAVLVGIAPVVTLVILNWWQ